MPWTIERKHDHVAVVTMNTNKVNAQNPVFFADLHAVFDRLEAEFSDCAVVLGGTGAVFSAGLDFDHQFSLNEVLIGIPMPAVYCEIIKHTIGPRAASELTLLGRVYDLAAVVKMGVIGKTAAPSRLLDDAVAWAALVPPDCYPAYAFTKRALQATTMAAIDAAARFDRDWLSRGMSDPASLRAQARRYRELKGREITWVLPS